MVDRGLIGNTYLRDWEAFNEKAVLLAPAYTYLMSNRPVDYQFWLNVGSTGWGSRLYQPLTHPYVMSRQWPPGRMWTDADEQQANEEALYTLALGLLRRCRKRVYLGFSQYGEQGFEQRGPLLVAVQRMLRRHGEGGGRCSSRVLNNRKSSTYKGGRMGVSAVPGSGKTRTLSYLAARLVADVAAGRRSGDSGRHAGQIRSWQFCAADGRLSCEMSWSAAGIRLPCADAARPGQRHRARTARTGRAGRRLQRDRRARIRRNSAIEAVETWVRGQSRRAGPLSDR